MGWNHEWYERNKERIAERNRKYYAERAEAMRDKTRNWRQANPDKVKAQKQRHTKKYLEREVGRIVAWKNADPDRNRKSGRDYIRRLKLEIIAGYGGKCECCGDTNWQFLTVDHINGDGARHRKTERQRNFYIRLRSEGFPRGEYRLLCMNCNFSYGMYGSCPHSSEQFDAVGLAC
jgi:hypothetical protein